MKVVESPYTKAEALSELLADFVKDYIAEIADDESQWVREKALRMMARRILREVPNM